MCTLAFLELLSEPKNNVTIIANIPDAGEDVLLLQVLRLDVLLPDGLKLLHAELLRRLHHGVRAGVLDSLGELSGHEEVILVQRSARV